MIYHEKEEQTTSLPGGNESRSANLSPCPIQPDADFTLLAFNCSHCALKQIRENLIHCQVCPEFDNCELHKQINARVDRSLSALNESWGWR
jgi:hypothetical protein